MSPKERMFAYALASCTFLPGIRVKKFAKDIAVRAKLEDESLIEDIPLTEKQSKYLHDSIWRYRRQIAPHIVAEASGMADKLKDELYPNRPKF